MHRRSYFIWIVFCTLSIGCYDKAPRVTHNAPTINESINEVSSDTESDVIDLTDEIDLYMVVAGAYSHESGALSKVQELKSMGFEYAEVVRRPGSNLYSALVDRFDDEGDAKAFTQTLASNHDIKSYVYHIE